MGIVDMVRVGAVAMAIVLAVGCKRSANTSAPPSPAASPVTQPRAGAGGAGDPCGPICERARGLACKNGAACAENCRQMAAVGACKDEMASVLGCFAREPIGHWECDENGEPSIKDGYCDAEQARFVACAEKSGATIPASKVF